MFLKKPALIEWIKIYPFHKLNCSLHGKNTIYIEAYFAYNSDSSKKKNILVFFINFQSSYKDAMLEDNDFFTCPWLILIT